MSSTIIKSAVILGLFVLVLQYTRRVGIFSARHSELIVRSTRRLTYDDLYPVPPVYQRIRTNTMVLRPDWRWTTKVYPQYTYPMEEE